MEGLGETCQGTGRGRHRALDTGQGHQKWGRTSQEKAQITSKCPTEPRWLSKSVSVLWAQTRYEMAGNMGQLARRTPCPGPTSSRALVGSAFRQWVHLWRRAWSCCHAGSEVRAGTGQPTTLNICSPTDTPPGKLPHSPGPSTQEALCPQPSLTVHGLCC